MGNDSMEKFKSEINEEIKKFKEDIRKDQTIFQNTFSEKLSEINGELKSINTYFKQMKENDTEKKALRDELEQSRNQNVKLEIEKQMKPLEGDVESLKKEVETQKSNSTWIKRTTIGALVGSSIGLIFTILTAGILIALNWK